MNHASWYLHWYIVSSPQVWAGPLAYFLQWSRKVALGRSWPPCVRPLFQEGAQDTHVERPCGGTCGPHEGAFPLRRNFISAGSAVSRELLAGAPSGSAQSSSRGRAFLCQPPGQWMSRVGCQSLAIMTVFAAEPHFGLTEAGSDQHWSPKLSLLSLVSCLLSFLRVKSTSWPEATLCNWASSCFYLS